MERVKIHYDNLHTTAPNSWYVEVPAESLEKSRCFYIINFMCSGFKYPHVFALLFYKEDVIVKINHTFLLLWCKTVFKKMRVSRETILMDTAEYNVLFFL